MSTVALIPARGGSKRLPRKNILDFHGKPIIAYTIGAALETGLFSEVVVSTEDDEIAEIAIDCGAIVDKRSPKLAEDTSSIVDVCSDFLNRREAAGIFYDKMVVLYATAPLRNSHDIVNVFNLLNGATGFAMAVTPCRVNFHQVMTIDDGSLQAVFPDMINDNMPRNSYCFGNGSTYAVNVEDFKQERGFYGKGVRGYMMPNERSIDIDTLEDYEELTKLEVM